MCAAYQDTAYSAAGLISILAIRLCLVWIASHLLRMPTFICENTIPIHALCHFKTALSIQPLKRDPGPFGMFLIDFCGP